MNRLLFFLTIVLILLMLPFSKVIAQEVLKSNTIITQVGNPKDPPPGSHKAAPPIPPEGARAAILGQFGITMNGYNDQLMTWAWEKLWDVSGTNFIYLTKGTTITARPGWLSQQLGCKSVAIGTDYPSEVAFKVTLTHELSHIVYWCNSDDLTHKRDHQNAFGAEGGVTGYGAAPCYGTAAIQEDYAEMLAYYLNPGVKEVTPCNNRNQIPYDAGRYPIHYNVAKSILGNY